MLKGRVRIIKTGLIKTLISPKIPAAMSAVKRESTLIPDTNHEASRIATVITSQRVMINIISSPLLPEYIIKFHLLLYFLIYRHSFCRFEENPGHINAAHNGGFGFNKRAVFKYRPLKKIGTNKGVKSKLFIRFTQTNGKSRAAISAARVIGGTKRRRVSRFHSVIIIVITSIAKQRSCGNS